MTGKPIILSAVSWAPAGRQERSCAGPVQVNLLGATTPPYAAGWICEALGEEGIQRASPDTQEVFLLYLFFINIHSCTPCTREL